MKIEDIILAVTDGSIRFGTYHAGFMESFSQQVNSRKAFTPKQSDLVIKTLRRYVKQILQVKGVDITAFLDSPEYKIPLRVLDNSRKIEVFKNDNGIKEIHVKFQFNPKIIEEFNKTTIPSNARGVWNPERMSWVFPLREESISFLGSMKGLYAFEADEEFDNYYQAIQKIVAECDNYVPSLVKEHGVYKFKNTSQYIPCLETTDIVEATLVARKYAVTMRDSLVDLDINESTMNDELKKLIKSSLCSEVEIKWHSDNFDHIGDIAKYMSPCLFVIPGSFEKEKTEIAYSILKKAGIPDSEISVLFRISKENNNKGSNVGFNEFVKENRLNNPVAKTTKAVIISGGRKLPKQIYESNIRFNCIFNFSNFNVLYSITNSIREVNCKIYVRD